MQHFFFQQELQPARSIPFREECMIHEGGHCNATVNLAWTLEAFSTTALSHSANLHLQPFCCGFFRLGNCISPIEAASRFLEGLKVPYYAIRLKAQCGATTLGDDPPSLALLAGGRSSKCGRQAHGVERSLHSIDVEEVRGLKRCLQHFFGCKWIIKMEYHPHL